MAIFLSFVKKLNIFSIKDLYWTISPIFRAQRKALGMARWPAPSILRYSELTEIPSLNQPS